MNSWHTEFGPFEGVWLNTAHQGALPRAAVAAAHEALSWKIAPSRLADDSFERVPGRLRQAISRLLNVPADEVILGNSTSYGLHVIANGIRWNPGDEVMVVDGDFPATVYPWLRLRERGVTVRLIRPRGAVIEADDVAANLTPATRLFCTTWVNSFTGHTADLDAVGEVCRARGVLFIVNATQALGARPIDAAGAPIDAIVGCGHKWLCGPYATGLCWIRPELRDSLDCHQAYWVTMQTGLRLSDMRRYDLRDDLGAAAFDVFAAANFNNFMPWTAAIESLLDKGIEAVAAHDQALVTRLIEGLDGDKYTLVSPRDGPARSTLAILSHRDAERNPAIRDRLAADGVIIALREGNLRVAPHLYNTPDDIDRALAALNAA